MLGECRGSRAVLPLCRTWLAVEPSRSIPHTFPFIVTTHLLHFTYRIFVLESEVSHTHFCLILPTLPASLCCRQTSLPDKSHNQDLLCSLFLPNSPCPTPPSLISGSHFGHVQERFLSLFFIFLFREMHFWTSVFHT